MLLLAVLTVFQLSSIIDLASNIGLDARLRLDHLSALAPGFYVYLVFQVVFLSLALLPDSSPTRVGLVVTLCVFSYAVTVLVTPREMGGDLVLLLAAALSVRFGFFKQRAHIKIAGMVLVLLAARMTVVANGNQELYRAVNQVAMGGAAVLFIYWIFEAETRRARSHARRLSRTLAQTQPFAEFGRNVRGLLEDLRADVTLFNSFGSILRSQGDEPLSSEIVDE